MKRTKEAYYRPNPTHVQTKQSSGLNFLIGEDVPYYVRQKDYQQLQKQFLDEQISQKKQIKETKKLTNQQYDQQLLHNTHQRGQLQLHKAQRLRNAEIAHDQYNLLMAKDRKFKEQLEKQRILEEEKRQLDLLNQRKVKRWVKGQQQ